MARNQHPILLIARVTLLLAIALPAAADRPEWNEPPQAPGYDRNGLLAPPVNRSPRVKLPGWPL